MDYVPYGGISGFLASDVWFGVSISSALGTKKRRNPQLAYSGECADYVFLLIDSGVLAGSKSLVLASVQMRGLPPTPEFET